MISHKQAFKVFAEPSISVARMKFTESGALGAHRIPGFLSVTSRLLDADVEFSEMNRVGIGSGWGVYSQELMLRLAGRVSYCETDNLPRARAIARLGARGFEQGLAVEVEQAMPVYLRDKVAKKESER